METARLDLQKPLYIVRCEAPRYYGDIEHSVIGDGDCLTDDPRCLDGVFEFTEEDWQGEDDVRDQQSYDDWLCSIHVSEATGEIRKDRFGNHWYGDEGEWRLIDEDDGTLSSEHDIDGPDDLDEWEMCDWDAYHQWVRVVHPSWRVDPDYESIIAAYRRMSVFVPRCTADLMGERDWAVPNPDNHVDLTPRVLQSGIELVRLVDAVSRGIARFVSHGGVLVLEVLHYDARPCWRDIHAFRPGVTEYQNVSAARLPYTFDNQVKPVCDPPSDISDWYIGYQHGSEYSKHVKWTISPLGLDWTSGGHCSCSLEEAAYMVGASRAS